MIENNNSDIESNAALNKDDPTASKADGECANRGCHCHVGGAQGVCNECCRISSESTHDVCECGHPECGGPIS